MARRYLFTIPFLSKALIKLFDLFHIFWRAQGIPFVKLRAYTLEPTLISSLDHSVHVWPGMGGLDYETPFSLSGSKKEIL